jgi:hypothetical protein
MRKNFFKIGFIWSGSAAQNMQMLIKNLKIKKYH